MSIRIACCGGFLFAVGVVIGCGGRAEFSASNPAKAGDDVPRQTQQTEDAAPPEDIQGVYSYGDFRLTFTKVGDGVYTYREDQGQGRVWEGPCIYKDGILAVAWVRASDGGNLGVSHIKVTRGADGNPQLAAYWTNLGAEVYEAYDPQPEYIGPIRGRQ